MVGPPPQASTRLGQPCALDGRSRTRSHPRRPETIAPVAPRPAKGRPFRVAAATHCPGVDCGAGGAPRPSPSTHSGSAPLRTQVTRGGCRGSAGADDANGRAVRLPGRARASTQSPATCEPSCSGTDMVRHLERPLAGEPGRGTGRVGRTGPTGTAVARPAATGRLRSKMAGPLRAGGPAFICSFWCLCR